ncbi:nitroreductase family deazaflavin-dependent oxidoreductase [Cellulomonas rhizosphaerae]|uniref:Nitroreductase family deazaflavin-dependent oxidoreductase n=1 Tax=Cellulomonas rhizosphaerae TaxID=2293719 RepID=A0A413RMY4_9CELL|nr:nitroreductase family deazaflavin-dependent oxidoreductase [Cellulomonas rhizosphaerae]RHA42337.1 nitroreductase family deazaflavin-dependent oxidoreductase [Cellulomonas rhizosphaerae]
MTAPYWVTRVNLVFTNKIMGTFSDDVPPLATLHHVGRTSGRRYRTPIMAFPTRRGFVIALTYGPGVQWLRNLEAGEGRLVRARRVHVLTDPVMLSPDEGAALVPRWTRTALRLLHVDDFVELAAAPA